MLEDSGAILSRANQALATLERYKTRLDEVSSTLSALEIEDLVTVRDVAVVAQRLEMVARIAREVEDYVVELGSEGRLLALQLEELVSGVESERQLVVRDYTPHSRGDGTVTSVLETLAALNPAELVDVAIVTSSLGLPASEPPGAAPAWLGCRPIGQPLWQSAKTALGQRRRSARRRWSRGATCPFGARRSIPVG